MKVKIVVTNLVVVLLFGVGVYFYLNSSLKTTFYNQNVSDLKADQKVFRDLLMLRGYQLMAEAQRKAAADEARAIFENLPPVEEEAESLLRKRAYEFADKYSQEELKYDPAFGRKPEIVAVTNPIGVVVARDTNINANVGEKWGEKFDLVKFALNGRAKWDFIEYNGAYLQAAASPIMKEGRAIGCLLVGFEVDNGAMDREGKLMGSDVGILISGKLYASSFDTDLTRKSLAGDLLTNEKERVKGALEGNKDSDIFTIKLNAEKFNAVISPVPGNFQVGKVGFVVLRSLKTSYAPTGYLWAVLGFMGLAAILVIVIGILLGVYFMKPVEAMEAEVRKIIEGDYEHRWEIKSAEVGGLSYLVNQMLDSLMGEDEEEPPPAEQERGPAVPQRSKTEEEFMQEGEAPAGEGAGDAVLAMPEAEYYRAIYQDFRGAKTRLGEDPNAIPLEQFIAKLKETEKSIVERQKVKGVRFQIQVQGNRINYIPIVIP